MKRSGIGLLPLKLFGLFVYYPPLEYMLPYNCTPCACTFFSSRSLQQFFFFNSNSKFINEWWLSVWWSFASNVLAWLLAFVSRMPSRPCVPSHPNEMDDCQGRNQRIRGNIYVSKSQPFMVYYLLLSDAVCLSVYELDTPWEILVQFMDICEDKDLMRGFRLIFS